MSNAKEAGHMGWKMNNSISEMNSVKGYRDGTASNKASTSLKALRDWFLANGSLPANDGASDGHEMSSMRGASCLKVNISTTQESTSTYGKTNNGTITISFHTASVNYELPAGTITSTSPAALSTKSYGFSKDGGGSWEIQASSSKTYSGLNSTDYTVWAKDFAYAGVFNGTEVKKTVTVTYGGGGKTYNNLFRS